jgi:hypothetical protein
MCQNILAFSTLIEDTISVRPRSKLHSGVQIEPAISLYINIVLYIDISLYITKLTDLHFINLGLYL